MMNLSGWLAYTTALNAQPEDWRYRETLLHGLLAGDDLNLIGAKSRLKMLKIVTLIIISVTLTKSFE